MPRENVIEITDPSKTVYVRPVVPPKVTEPPKPEPPPLHQPKIKEDSVNAGCLIQFIGVLCFLFVAPFGILFGVILLIVGGCLARKYRCSECGNRIDSKEVKICPVCRVNFGKNQQPRTSRVF